MYQIPFTEYEEFWYVKVIPKLKRLKMFIVENGKENIYISIATLMQADR